MNNKKNIEETFEDILLSEIPFRKYQNILVINGDYKLAFKNKFEGKVKRVNIISKNLSKRAKLEIEGSVMLHLARIILCENIGIFQEQKYDLIVISSILYQRYIGESLNLIYYLIDNLMENKGILVSIHQQGVSKSRFPYLLLHNYFFDSQNKQFILEAYIK